jgi:hypothetical protein
MLAFNVGTTEWLFGTRRTFVLFWASHLLTLLIQSLLLAIPLHQLGAWWGTLLAAQHDVGPSAGYYGCLGAICRQFPGKWRRWVIAGVSVSLIARLTISLVRDAGDVELTIAADLAHLIAFPIGLRLAKNWSVAGAAFPVAADDELPH